MGSMRSMNKKWLAGMALGAVVMALAGCGSSGGQTSAGNSKAGVADSAGKENADWTWERKIEIIVPYGNGGGADITTRQFAAALEKQIGVPVVINNKAGAGGVTGTEFALSQPADGYTWFFSTPSVLLASINGSTDMDVYGKVNPLFQMVHDCNVFVTSAEAPYSTYEELMEYVKANPGSVKCGVMSITGLDAACVKGTFGDEVEAVAYSEGSQLNADVIGGHVALACVGPADVSAMIESGDMKPVLTCTEQRLTIDAYSDTQCTGELGIDCYYGPYRFIAYKEGTPEAACEALLTAAEKASADEDFQKWVREEGLDQRQIWKGCEELKAQWDSDKAEFEEIFGQ